MMRSSLWELFSTLGETLKVVSFTIPYNILLQIKATPMASDPNMQDTLVWAFSNDGSFDPKYAYLRAKDLNLLNLNTSKGKMGLESDYHTQNKILPMAMLP